jgi:5-methylcytosine-specific restriction protein A
MPRMPPAQCDAPRCKAPAAPHSRFCVDHTPARAPAPSRADGAAYKSAAWAQLRAAQLSRAPLCAGCQSRGIVTAATVVDHVWPWRAIGPHAFRANRFQSLCPECHSIKTALESRGTCREFGVRDWALADYPATA